MKDDVTYHKYVELGFVHVWEKLGWVIAKPGFRGIHHGEYSELLNWPGPGEPVYPKMEAAA